MCDFPINIKNPLFGKVPGEMKRVLVPCSKCVQCTTRRSNQWWIRLHYELKQAISAYFVTLTYEVPPRTFNELQTVNKRDLQLYFKRLRKREMFNSNIKYYAVSEYGEMKQRPHYHAIIFNVQHDKNLHRAWKVDKQYIGNVHVGEVTDASIKYVTGYIGKKVGIPLTDYDDREKEFSLMSKNMGLYYITHVAKWNKEHQAGYTIIDGAKYPLPRYYKNKIFNDYERRQIGRTNQAYFLEAQLKEEKNFNSILDWERNKQQIALRNNRKQQIIVSSNF